MGFHITGDVAADAVLDASPFAVLVGMLLDPHHPRQHGTNENIVSVGGAPVELFSQAGAGSPR